MPRRRDCKRLDLLKNNPSVTFGDSSLCTKEPVCKSNLGLQNFIRAYRCFYGPSGVSLRLGHARVLTTPRVVIHCARAAPLRRPLQILNKVQLLKVYLDINPNKEYLSCFIFKTCRDRRPRRSIIIKTKDGGTQSPLTFL